MRPSQVAETREFYTASAVQELRDRLGGHLRRPDPPPPHGWSKLTADLAPLVSDLRHLRPKPGLALRGYQFLDRNSGSGRSAIYAMPEQAPLPEPQDCQQSEGPVQFWFDTPVPPGALEPLTDGFDGDGSPDSFLETSILVRELADFISYRFVQWPVETVLDTDPFVPGQPEPDPWWRAPARDSSGWSWHEAPPTDWRPCVQMNDDGSVAVRFFAYFPPGIQTLRRHVDTYPPGSYRATATCDTIAEGKVGFLW